MFCSCWLDLARRIEIAAHEPVRYKPTKELKSAPQIRPTSQSRSFRAVRRETLSDGQVFDAVDGHQDVVRLPADAAGVKLAEHCLGPSVATLFF